jgi:hypothetical protein
VAENKAQVEAAKEAQTFSFKPFDQITYREWLIGQLSVGHGLQPKPVLAQIVASADELICLAQTGVCESKVAKQDIMSLPEYQYLPVRVRKCLVAAKIQTLLDLSMRNPHELLRIKNVGVTSICDLMKLLEAYGMTFPVRWP